MGTRHFRRLTVAGLALSVLLTGCSPQAPGAAPPTSLASGERRASTGDSAQTTLESSPGEPVTFADLRTLGEKMTAALAGGDVEQWMALTALEGAADQQQRDWFASVRAVPMDLREMHPTFLVRTDNGEGGATAQFAFRHQVTGVDSVPVVEAYELTLAHVQGRWRVTEVTGTNSDESTYPQLWDVAPISVAETDHVVILSVGDSLSGEVISNLDAAAAGVLEELPVEGGERVLMEYADPQVVATMLAADGVDVRDMPTTFYLPLASPTADREESAELPDVEDGDFGTGRLIVNREIHDWEIENYYKVGGGSPSARSGLAAMALMQRHPHFVTPEWVDTGVSWWFELSGDTRMWASAREDYAIALGDVTEVEGFPPDNYWEFYADDAPWELYQHQSATIVMFLDERFGRDAMFSLVDDLAVTELAAGDSEERIDAAFEAHLGVGRDEAEKQWLAWLNEEFGDQ